MRCLVDLYQTGVKRKTVILSELFWATEQSSNVTKFIDIMSLSYKSTSGDNNFQA